MKTIIYLLIAIIFFGLIATSFTSMSYTTKITIQSTDTKISSASLLKSAEIIANRLRSFSSEKFYVVPFPNKNQIEVTLLNNWDLNFVHNLICKKGVIQFYETYNNADLCKLLKSEQLLSLLHSKVTGNSSEMIGCVASSEINNIDGYLNARKLDLACKFAWNDLFNNSEVCLYALKFENGKGVLLSGKDIEGFNYNLFPNRIGFKLKITSVGLWSDITTQNINKHIAIVFDNKVLAAPLITSEMNNEFCEILLNFTHDQLRYLIAIGNSGELPSNFTILN